MSVLISAIPCPRMLRSPGGVGRQRPRSVTVSRTWSAVDTARNRTNSPGEPWCPCSIALAMASPAATRTSWAVDIPTSQACSQPRSRDRTEASCSDSAENDMSRGAGWWYSTSATSSS